MNAVLIYIIQVNLLLSLIYLGYYLLLRKLTFYRLNRVYLLIASIYALVYPLLDMSGWFRRTVEMPILWSYLPPEMITAPTATYSIFTLDNALLSMLAVGACLLLLRLFVQMLSLRRIHSHSNLSKWGNYLYRNVLYPIVPFSFFNKIYLHKAQHSEPELYDIFEHETIHVKGLHSLDILLFEMLWIVCWYNPFVWLMRKAVRQNIEFLTDQQVLNRGVDRQTYQYSLLNVTQQGTVVGIGNQFNFKTLKKRIMMMNKKRSSKLELSKYAFLLPILILVGATFTVNKAEGKIEKAVSMVEKTDLAQLVSKQATETTDTQNTTIPTTEEVSLKQEQDTVRPLKSRAEINQNKDYIYEYDKKRISKAQFFAFPDNEVYDILLIEDKQALSVWYPDEDNMHGIVRARSLEGHEKAKEISKKILIVIDGEIKENTSLSELDPNKIESMNVLKDQSSTAKYGEKGKDGVIEITTKGETKAIVDTLKGKAVGLRIRGISTQSGLNKPFFIVDGKEMPTDFDRQSLDPDQIESITVLKDDDAKAVYGDKGKEGVILIKTKSKDSQTSVWKNTEEIAPVTIIGYRRTDSNNEVINENLDSHPQPEGGMQNFRQWVANNFQYPIDAINAGIKGTLIMTFVVRADGSLSDIKAINDLGHNIGQSAANLLKRSPKWEPGTKDGKQVNVRYTFPIKLDLSTFESSKTE